MTEALTESNVYLIILKSTQKNFINSQIGQQNKKSRYLQQNTSITIKQQRTTNIFINIFFTAHILTVKSTDVINNTKDGSRLLKCPSEPRQRDGEREQDPETDAAKFSHRYS